MSTISTFRRNENVLREFECMGKQRFFGLFLQLFFFCKSGIFIAKGSRESAALSNSLIVRQALGMEAKTVHGISTAHCRMPRFQSPCCP